MLKADLQSAGTTRRVVPEFSASVRLDAEEAARAIATRFFSRCEEEIDVIVFDPAHLSPEQSDFLARISKVRIA